MGVPGPPADRPPEGKRSGADDPDPALTEVAEFVEGRGDVLPCVLPPLLSWDGRGLFRGSVKDVVEADGVATGDCAASLEELACDEGDDVPSLESFLDFEALFGSLVRESCSC